MPELASSMARNTGRGGVARATSMVLAHPVQRMWGLPASPCSGIEKGPSVLALASGSARCLARTSARDARSGSLWRNRRQRGAMYHSKRIHVLLFNVELDTAGLIHRHHEGMGV